MQYPDRKPQHMPLHHRTPQATGCGRGGCTTNPNTYPSTTEHPNHAPTGDPDSADLSRTPTPPPLNTPTPPPSRIADRSPTRRPRTSAAAMTAPQPAECAPTREPTTSSAPAADHTASPRTKPPHHRGCDSPSNPPTRSCRTTANSAATSAAPDFTTIPAPTRSCRTTANSAATPTRPTRSRHHPVDLRQTHRLARPLGPHATRLR